MDKPLGYLGGDIMSFGSNLARQYEYDKFKELGLDVDVYSPVMNKDINDKKSVTEEENNHLAEKITRADIDRLWNSDFVVMSPEQSAIGSMCETGCLYGWKYMADQLVHDACYEVGNFNIKDWSSEDKAKAFDAIMKDIDKMFCKKNYFHYFDIRDTDINEKGWRRSFSINQLLYGMILYASWNKEGFQSLDEIFECLEKDYKK